MRNRLRSLLVLVLLSAGSSLAQRVFYDATRDTQAQSAAAASKDVLSGSLFDLQLKNLEQLGTRQLETVLRWQEVKMRAALNSFTTWNDILVMLKQVDDNLAPFLDTAGESAQAAKRLAEIKQLAADIPKTLKEIQDKNTERRDAIGEILSHVGDVKEAVSFANDSFAKKNPAGVNALNEVVATLEQVQTLYASVKSILAGAAAVNVPVASLRPDPLQTELELLRVEQVHLQRLGLIRARQALEVGDIKETLDAARNFVTKFPPDESIELTLAGLKMSGSRDRLEFALFALYYAAAVAAQQETSASLAALRKSIEERRYSIERSAVSAGTYEQTTRAVDDRLALYWKAGVKPKDLAGLLYDLSTAVSLPILASKQ